MIAKLYYKEGQLAEALPFARQAAEIFGRIGGADAKRAKDFVEQIRAESR